ncbi:cache domain-containing sensor histidine kinase [Paenibacillus agricola]|uniref:histidine kinase n=1 Tax=Paenibacillus agricola TaxID=2716264 RepID=A0ABX0JJD3_9BACL|nr:sensor histidine kinase [Paenibacillus agricola]NHN35461.1 sensor histidine kinase [Paenibacillus agricola]
MKWKIKSKLMLITFCIVSIALVCSGSFTYYYVTEMIREQSIQDSQVKLSQNAFQIKRIQERTEKIAEYIISDSEIQLLLKTNQQLNKEQAYFQKKAVEERLKKFTALNDFIFNVLIVRADGEMFSNNAGYENYFESNLQEKWFKELASEGGNPQFSTPHPFYYGNGNGELPAVSYVVRYRSLDEPINGEELYTLLINIKYSEFTAAFQQSLGQYEQMLLVNSKQDILFNSKEEAPPFMLDQIKLGTGTGNGYLEDRQYIVIYNQSMLKGWTQMAIISKKNLFAKINSILFMYVTVILCSLIVIFSVMTPTIANITRPISQMVSAMKRVSEGDLNMQISIRSGDELEILGKGFNRMITELKEHVRSSIESEKLKRTMQLQLLMAQINPHFIYNTLNTVIYLSHANRNREAEQMTQSLIGILQDSVHKGDSSFFTRLAGEIGIVEKYAEIQQCRYPNRFQLEWNIDARLNDLVVPKMILQPIVENALFHGICSMYMEDMGWIRIQAIRTEERVEISIEDNGKGMSAEQRENLCAAETGSTDRDAGQGGIGLANVRERIWYHYGKDFGMDIESSEGKGTRVTLKLPLSSVL